MPLAIGIGIGASLEGVGVSWAVGTPTIAVVSPVTNPPHFDVGFDIAGGDATQVGDVARHLIDGVYDASYNFTFDGDPTENVTGNTLTAGAHTAQVAIFRAGVQVSAWSSVANYTTPSTSVERQFAVPGAYINSGGLRQFAIPGTYIVEVAA
jgi:hypothetical protein